jgi:hypothetical protein
MRECDNSKIHISSNFLFSICLLIMLDTLLLVPSLYCNTSLHFTTLIDTSLPLIYTSLPSHLAYPIYISYCSISLHNTKLDRVWFSHPQTYFQSNEPPHCPKEIYPRNMVCFSYIIVNTLHKDDNKDNNNNRTHYFDIRE